MSGANTAPGSRSENAKAVTITRGGNNHPKRNHRLGRKCSPNGSTLGWRNTNR